MVFDLLLSFFWALVVSMFAIPSIVRVSHSKNLLDEPGERRLHRNRTPRLGGLAIFAGFISSLTIFGVFSDSIQKSLAGIIIVFFVGLKDDIISVAVFKKFFVQLLASAIIIFVADVRITSLHGFLGIGQLELSVSYLISFLTVVGITNSINLIDGLDGLAGSIVSVIALTFGIYFFSLGEGEFYYYAFVAFALLGAVVGFLRYNFYKAIIFMGDTGSLVCGLIVSVLAINLLEMPGLPTSPSIALAAVIIPAFDTLRVFALRIYKGRSPFSPDKNHIHHVLIRLGFKPFWALIFLISTNILFVIGAILLNGFGNNLVIGGIVGLCVIIGVVLEIIILKRAPFYSLKSTENEAGI